MQTAQPSVPGSLANDTEKMGLVQQPAQERIDNMTIKEMRETSGLSQIKICELTGVPTRTWRSWETGERACPEYVVRLIRYFLENEGVLKNEKVEH